MSTTPAVDKGICYGQTDLDVTESFFEEAEMILRALPPGIVAVYSSPLQRCTRLARHLFPICARVGPAGTDGIALRQLGDARVGQFAKGRDRSVDGGLCKCSGARRGELY